MAEKKKRAEDVAMGLNQLRLEQRQLNAKIAELEADAAEHRLVIEALSTVDETRKCFRLVGGVLVERTVRDVRPSLNQHRDKIQELIEQLKAQVLVKAQEIRDFVQKNDVRFRPSEGIAT